MRHEDAGKNQRGDEGYEPHLESRDRSQHHEAGILDLGRESVRESRQICRGLHPEIVQTLADERPACNRPGRRRNAKAAALDDGRDVIHRVRCGHAQHVGRHKDDRERGQNDQRRDQSAVAARCASQPNQQRMERDRQNQRPDQQIEKRDDDPEAEDREHDDEPSADQHIQQTPRERLL
jgi:hypothetical protein